ncbi:MAG: GNAT family N-acetyltransferase [Armatimonadetes bacterium]|nr:GNAT family N-acetyltransferase [Armatimonadota bacterium]
MIIYNDSIANITVNNLQDFFKDWSNPPSAETNLKVLENSDKIVLAIDDQTGNVVGFITAISDSVLCAYISFIEVLPEYKRMGIGTELTRRMLEKLKGIQMIDLRFDRNLQPFYEIIGIEKFE